MNTIGIDDALEQTFDCTVDLFRDVFVCLLLETLDKGGENGVETLVEGTASDTNKRGKGSRVEGCDWLDNECWDEDREDTVGPDLGVSFDTTASHQSLTLMTSCKACNAVSEPSPGLRIASSRVGIV